MKDLFNKLNPAERRLVVIVGIAVFIVINVFIWKSWRGEYGRLQDRQKKAQGDIDRFQAEIKNKRLYEQRIRDLMQQGPDVPTEEAALRLSQEVNAQAALSGVTLDSITPVNRGGSGGKTNAFFDEASVSVNINTGEKEFIDFLYRLAQNDLLIRAKSMNIQPDVPGRMKLQGRIDLVKSYQRKQPLKAAATAKATNAPAKAPAKAPPAPSTTVTNKPKK